MDHPKPRNAVNFSQNKKRNLNIQTKAIKLNALKSTGWCTSFCTIHWSNYKPYLTDSPSIFTMKTCFTKSIWISWLWFRPWWGLCSQRTGLVPQRPKNSPLNRVSRTPATPSKDERWRWSNPTIPRFKGWSSTSMMPGYICTPPQN